jgi:hypothetical protein
MSRDQQNSTTRRALLTAGPAAAVALSGGTALAAMTPDPIFAAIDEYKAAVQARQVALDRDEDKDRRGFDGEWDAFYEMLDTMPTTVAGVVAMLEVLGTDPYEGEEGDGGLSAAGWAYNDGNEECPVDRLLLTMARTLRTSGGGT